MTKHHAPSSPPALRADRSPSVRESSRASGAHPRFQSLDLLATLVAVVDADGAVLFANAALEDALGISRRSISGALLQECREKVAERLP